MKLRSTRKVCPDSVMVLRADRRGIVYGDEARVTL